jgi:glycosyltransferase involved in cell wall biosynthesis
MSRARRPCPLPRGDLHAVPRAAPRSTPIARSEPAIVRTAFVATYPPRRCGIAAFTGDLSRVMENREIVALHPPEQVMPYPVEVHHRIRRDELADYTKTARGLGACVDVASLQLGHGIWGGDDGDAVNVFLAALDIPAVATFHAIEPDPNQRERAVVVEVVQRVQATVVMSRSAASLLASAYGIRPDQIAVIPHGVPNLPLVTSEATKAGLDLAGRQVILSFGLLAPAKGYETALDALPAIVAQHPTACYVIVGATQPDLLRRDGEAYRAALADRVKAMGMTGHVRFVDRFVGRVELTHWLQAADVVVTPYPQPGATVSGTLSAAMAAGRPVVSTRYSYAEELLADGRGVIAGDGSPDAIAAAIIGLLDDDTERLAIGLRAYEASRRMVWPEVGAAYRRLFERVVAVARTPVGSSGVLSAAITA